MALILKTLVNFDGGNGANPLLGSLSVDAAGDLFGTTSAGGTSDDGTVFELVDLGGDYTLQTLINFDGSAGLFPAAGVIADASGDLFGTTTGGGAGGRGTVFELPASGPGGYSPETLASFNVANGAEGWGGLVADAHGDLFGTTAFGGTNNLGTVFELVNTGSGSYGFRTLVNFSGANGNEPLGTLLADASGDLFGTTEIGGAYGNGTVFELVNTGGGYALRTLVSFDGDSGDGSNLYGGLIADANGDLFGTTAIGGRYGDGTVFELVNTGGGSYTLQALMNFDGSNGADPYGALVADASGDLYGTTQVGGTSGQGTLFELVKNSVGGYTPRVLINFNSAIGVNPFSGLIVDANGDLFGTTETGGAHGDGTVFEIISQPTGTSPVTLTGDEFDCGSAASNSRLDAVTVAGNNNTIWEQYGNLTVSGTTAPATDSLSTIRIGGDAVADNISLAGGGNRLYDFGGSTLVNANISFTVTGVIGGNVVSDDVASDVPLSNSNGTTTITLGGTGNQVYLNGDASNSVSLGAGAGVAYIGDYSDDDLFGWTSSITFSGTANRVVGGDENFSITDATVASAAAGSDAIDLGDGTDTVTLTGGNNTIVVGGGADSIDAGQSNAAVYVYGIDHVSGSDGADDPGVPATPTDKVTIRGGGDIVGATYENVIIFGAAVTSTAKIQLGDGNNQITLGGTGHDLVNVGGGENQITASGDASIFNLGDGLNDIRLTGNGNLLVATDPTGVGRDTVALGAGANDQIFLGDAGGSVTDSGTGATYVTQSGPNNVSINLGGGAGLVSLGDGGNTVTANGNGSVIIAGNGNNNVTAGGSGDVVHLGNGANKVIAKGNHATIIPGDGANTVFATGTNDFLQLGNGDNVLTLGNIAGAILGNGDNAVTAGNGDVVIFGDGGNTVTSGTGGKLSFHANAASVNNAQVGGDETVYQQNGVLHVTEATANLGGNIFNLNNLGAGSSLIIVGVNDQLSFASDANANVRFNPSATNATISVCGDNPTAFNNYSGVLNISGFGPNQRINLRGLIGALNNQPLNSFAALEANVVSSGFSDSIMLKGGGTINVLNTLFLSAREFVFSAPGSVPAPI